VIEALLQTLLNGAASGGVYALVALGYTLVFSVLGVINFAQGALFSVGGYLTYLLMGGKIGVNGALPGWGLPAGLPFPLALLLAAAGSGLIGLLVERLAFAPLRRRNAEPLLALITSLGAGVVLVNLLQLLMGAEGYAFPPSTNALAGLPAVLVIGGPRIRTIQLLLLIISAAAVLALSLWLERSKGGRALRAVAEDATTAQLLGIHSEAMVRLAFFLSGALAGLGGGLIGVRQRARRDRRWAADGFGGSAGAQRSLRLARCPGLRDPFCRTAVASQWPARPAHGRKGMSGSAL
jgi:branched-chain amino acid transport system permease protein